MSDWVHWLARMENSKVLALLLFFAMFVAIIVYLFAGRKRGERLESYKYIPFDEDPGEKPGPKETQDE